MSANRYAVLVGNELVGTYADAEEASHQRPKGGHTVDLVVYSLMSAGYPLGAAEIADAACPDGKTWTVTTRRGKVVTAPYRRPGS